MSGIKLGSNIASLSAQRRLGEATAEVQSGLERLSSGLRINRASDDAAGLSIASKLRSDTRVFTTAIRNLNDGVSALSIAEGALGELTNISIRQRELASQAANGSYSITQRRAMNSEANSLVDEFNRIVQSTSFNGTQLIDKSISELRLQGGYGTDGSINFRIGDALARTVGNGSYQTAYSHSANAYFNLTADLNRDGKQDLITSDGGTALYVSIGNGNGTFKAKVNYSNAAFDVTVGDFNGDGIPDLAAGDYSNGKVRILIGNGDGSFKAHISYAAGGNPHDISAADFNGDGALDVATNTYNGNSVYVLLNNGDGTFAAGISYTVNNTVGSRGQVVGDFDGNGSIDIVAGRRILLNNGNGTFKAAVTIATTTSTALTADPLRMGDFNGDGNLDISTLSGSNLGILLGNGDGTFKTRVNYQNELFNSMNGADVNDLNGDGVLDIVASGTAGDAYVFLGNTNGTFASGYYLAGGGPSGSTSVVTSGDYNQDGSIDIITSSTHVNDASRIFIANNAQISTTPYLNINTQAGARSAMTTIDATLQRISLELGAIGSTQSRVGVALNTLQASRENYSAAGSRITDVDVAQETGDLVRNQILQKASAAVLAQANQTPVLALKLLGAN